MPVYFARLAFNVSPIHLLQAFLISASPVAELRLALPLALYDYQISWYVALPVCLLGNWLPVPFLLLFLEPLSRVAAKLKPLKIILDWVFQYTRRRGRLVERYERLGLMIFVAIPFPGSGAWTGSILAFLLGMRFKQALISVVLGVFIAGVVVTILSLLGWVGAMIAGAGLIILATLGLWRI